MFPLMPRKISQRNQSVPFSWNETRYRFFSRFRSPNRFKKNELIIRLYDRGRKVVREEFRSNWISRNEKKKKGGKNLKFLFRFPEKRTVYEKGGQGWMGQIKFCSPWKIGFLSVFPAQPAATKWSRQCGNEVHSGHGFWLAGNRFAFSFRPRPAFQNFSPQPEDTPPWLHTR